MTQDQLIRVRAVVVDQQHMTLYLEDGKKLLIPQGDSRIQRIVEEVMPICNRGEIAAISLHQDNVYKEFEKTTNGFVRFFRVAKKALAKIFTEEVSDPPGDADSLEAGLAIDKVTAIQRITIKQGDDAKLAAVNEIVASATPVSSNSFKDIPVGDHENEDTIIGVTEKGEVIPGMQNLKGQMDRASKLGSAVGVQAFLDRLAKVIQYRKHSVDDLLKFMERGDLPIADDGSIIIYKVLRKSTDGRYVDCHTKKVSQKVGSYVCMDPKLVDHNRKNECSNGLHVARRGYIKNFSGDVCVMAKVAPEDVIAVPDYDANKMRVCGYHILFELSEEAYSKLRANQPITGIADAQAMLAKALSGKHIGKLEKVQIHGGYGSDVIITPLLTAEEARQSVGENLITKDTPQAEPISDANAPETKAAPVDPNQVRKAVQAIKKADLSPRQHRIQELLSLLNDSLAKVAERKSAVTQLRAIKKAAKQSYDALGIKEADLAVVEAMADEPLRNVTVPKGIKVKADPVAKVVITKDVKVKPVPMGRNDTARQHFDVLTDRSRVLEARKTAASYLSDLKKKSKVSYEKLGLPANTGDLIEKTLLEKTPIDQQKAKPAPAPKEGIAVTKTVNDTDKVYLINTRGEYSLGATKGCTPDISKAHVYEYQEVKHLISQGMRIQLIPAEQSQAKKSEKKSTPKESKPNGTSNNRNSIDKGSSSVVAKGAVKASPVTQGILRKEDIAKADAEAALTEPQRNALVAIRGGATVTQAAKKTGVSRRSIDRLIAKFGK